MAQSEARPPLPQWHFEFNAQGKPNKIVFKRSATYAYDLEYSGNLAAWTNVAPGGPTNTILGNWPLPFLLLVA